MPPPDLSLPVRSEADVEMRLVLPMLRQLGWGDGEVHSKVPVSFTTGTKRGRPFEADFVLAHPDPIPPRVGFVVVEVKRPDEGLDDAADQALSYAVALKAALYCVCNGQSLQVLRHNWGAGPERIFECAVVDLVTRWGDLESILSRASVFALYQSLAPQRLPAAPLMDEAAKLKGAETKARVSSGDAIGSWKERHKFSTHTLVRLQLQKQTDRSSRSADPDEWSIERVVSDLAASRHIILSGRPGAGKTLTLLQLAEVILQDQAALVPVVVSVATWVASGERLKTHITQQLFGDEPLEAEAELLFKKARVVLLLNGWNEVDEGLQVAANEKLRDFTLHYPGVPLLMTTRPARIPPAVSDALVLEVAHLSGEQKALIIRASGIQEPERFLAQLRDDHALSRVTDTPLFLAAAVELTRKGRPMPATRALLLDGFVDVLEHTDNHFDVLQSGSCHGFHVRYLECIADAMMSRGLTVLSADECHSVITRCGYELVQEGHLVSAASGADVADSLVRHHLLVPVPGRRPGYEFLHQQFQELFAARSLERRIVVLLDAPEPSAVRSLQVTVLDRQHWRQSIELMLELLTTAGNNDAAVSLIRWIAPLDLIVASELCDVAGQRVWVALREELTRTLRVLYEVGGAHRKCALAAMLATGVDDFSDLIWSQLRDNEQSVYELVSWTGNYVPFRARSLGAGWQHRVAKLSNGAQEAFLLEVCAGEPEIAFAEERAGSDSPEVRAAACALLAHQGRFASVGRALAAADVSHWPARIVVRHWENLPHEIKDKFLRTAVEVFHAANDLILRRSIVEVLSVAGDRRWVDLAKQEMETAIGQFDTTPRSVILGGVLVSVSTAVSTISYFAGLLRLVDLEWVANWLASKLGRHLWGRPFAAFIAWFPASLVTQLIGLVLEPAEATDVSERVNAIVDNGLAAIDALVELYVRTQDKRLRVALRDLPISKIAASIIRASELPQYSEHTMGLVELLLPCSLSDRRLDESLGASLCNELKRLLRQVAAAMPDTRDDDRFRALLAVLLGSLRDTDSVATVVTWTMREQTRWEVYHSRTRDDRRAKGAYEGNWWWWYRSALSRFQCPVAEQALTDWLDSPFLAGEGAQGLVEFSLLEGSLAPRISVHAVPGPVPVQRHRFASPDQRVYARGTLIANALQNVDFSINADTQRAKADAIAALAELNDQRAVAYLISVDSPVTDWKLIDASAAMSHRGTVLSGGALAARLRSFIDSHGAIDRLGDVNSWTGVHRALSVLMACDEPAVAIVRIRAFLEMTSLPAHCFRDLCVLVGASDKVEAADLLLETSRRLDQQDTRFQYVIESLGATADARCHQRLLELLLQGAVAPNGHRDTLARTANELAKKQPRFCSSVMESLGTLSGNAVAYVASVLAEVGSEEAALGLLRYSDVSLVEPALVRIVQLMTQRSTPIPNSNAFRIHPAEATSLRRHLAAQLVSRDVMRCAIASRLLMQIRAERVTFGPAPNEPLHPDVELLGSLAGNWELCCTAHRT